jgi:hypothetical protein
MLFVQLGGQGLDAGRVDVDHRQLGDAHAQRRVRDGRAGAAGPEQHHPRQVGIGQRAV